MSIISSIKNIKDEIPDKVRLIAVTKKVPVEFMRQAYETGIRDVSAQ